MSTCGESRNSRHAGHNCDTQKVLCIVMNSPMESTCKTKTQPATKMQRVSYPFYRIPKKKKTEKQVGVAVTIWICIRGDPVQISTALSAILEVFRRRFLGLSRPMLGQYPKIRPHPPPSKSLYSPCMIIFPIHSTRYNLCR
jgi:hypothetical protein